MDALEGFISVERDRPVKFRLEAFDGCFVFRSDDGDVDIGADRVFSSAVAAEHDDRSGGVLRAEVFDKAALGELEQVLGAFVVGCVFVEAYAVEFDPRVLLDPCEVGSGERFERFGDALWGCMYDLGDLALAERFTCMRAEDAEDVSFESGESNKRNHSYKVVTVVYMCWSLEESHSPTSVSPSDKDRLARPGSCEWPEPKPY